MRSPLRTAAAGALAAVLAAGCAAGGTGAPADRPVVVVTSTSVWGSVARSVAGDALVVSPIITSATADPHVYPGTPQDASLLGRADLVVVNGGGYDEWLTALLADRADTPVVEAFALGDGGDEHVFYDLPTVAAVAEELSVRFGELVPARAAEFTANAGTFALELDGVAERVEGIARAHPGARVALTEPMAGPLVESAGLVDAAPDGFAEATEDGVPPPPDAAGELIRLVAAGRVAVVVDNVQRGTPASGQVRDAALAAGVPVVEVTETLPVGVEYVEWMAGQVDALAAALDTGTAGSPAG